MKDVKSGDYLDDAVEWFKSNNIPLYGINVNPSQTTWTKSPKAYGQLYIDDAAHGASLKFDINIPERPFIDWEKVNEMLIADDII